MIEKNEFLKRKEISATNFLFVVKYVEIVLKVVYVFEIENTPSSKYLILRLNYE